jgi:alpha-amylase/alpha-mannosidase (GH57 family)
MQAIIFYFHHPLPLSNFTFFDIGTDKAIHKPKKWRESFATAYHDKYEILLNAVIEAGQKGQVFNLIFTGSFLQQLYEHVPTMVQQLSALEQEQKIGIIPSGYYGSLIGLVPEIICRKEVEESLSLFKKLFGKIPTTFTNPYLVYDDSIGGMMSGFGITTCLAPAMTWHLAGRTNSIIFKAAKVKNMRLLLAQSSKEEKGPFASAVVVNAAAHDGGNTWELVHQYANNTPALQSIDKIAESHEATEEYRVPRPISINLSPFNLASLTENPLQRSYLNRLNELTHLATAAKNMELINQNIRPLYAVSHLEQLNTQLVPHSEDPYFYYLKLGHILTDIKLRLSAEK